MKKSQVSFNKHVHIKRFGANPKEQQPTEFYERRSSREPLFDDSSVKDGGKNKFNTIPSRKSKNIKPNKRVSRSVSDASSRKNSGERSSIFPLFGRRSEMNLTTIPAKRREMLTKMPLSANTVAGSTLSPQQTKSTNTLNSFRDDNYKGQVIDYSIIATPAMLQTSTTSTPKQNNLNNNNNNNNNNNFYNDNTIQNSHNGGRTKMQTIGTTGQSLPAQYSSGVYPNNVHGSQLPTQKLPLTRGVTVDLIAKKLLKERLSPPPRLSSPAFSYTRPQPLSEHQNFVATPSHTSVTAANSILMQTPTVDNGNRTEYDNHQRRRHHNSTDKTGTNIKYNNQNGRFPAESSVMPAMRTTSTSTLTPTPTPMPPPPPPLPTHNYGHNESEDQPDGGGGGGFDRPVPLKNVIRNNWSGVEQMQLLDKNFRELSLKRRNLENRMRSRQNFIAANNNNNNNTYNNNNTHNNNYINNNNNNSNSHHDNINKHNYNNIDQQQQHLIQSDQYNSNGNGYNNFSNGVAQNSSYRRHSPSKSTTPNHDHRSADGGGRKYSEKNTKVSHTTRVNGDRRHFDEPDHKVADWINTKLEPSNFEHATNVRHHNDINIEDICRTFLATERRFSAEQLGYGQSKSAKSVTNSRFRERSIDDGSHFDPRLDKQPAGQRETRSRHTSEHRTPSRSNENDPKHAKPAISRLQKVKRFLFDSKPKQPKATAVAVHKSEKWTPETQNIAMRRRLSTPKASPLPKRTRTPMRANSTASTLQKPSSMLSGSWFKSLDRKTLKNVREEDATTGTGTTGTTTDLRRSERATVSAIQSQPDLRSIKSRSRSIAPQQPFLNDQQTNETKRKNSYRYFGDTDSESKKSSLSQQFKMNDNNMKTTYENGKIDKSNSVSLQNISVSQKHSSKKYYTPVETSEDDIVLNFAHQQDRQPTIITTRPTNGRNGSLLRQPKGDKHKSSMPNLSLNHHQNNFNTLNSAATLSKANKAKMSTRTKETNTLNDYSPSNTVYLHDVLIGDIPRQEYSSVDRKSIAKDYKNKQSVRSVTRSVELSAPWKPKHIHEGYEIDYFKNQY